MYFGVKFYHPDPSKIEDEHTRHLFCLQIKKDLSEGSLQCNENIGALIASYIIQSEIGNFNPDKYIDPSYLSSFPLIPHQDAELEWKIQENHKEHIGLTIAQSDYYLLETASKLDYYGVKLTPVKGCNNIPLNIAVNHVGILIFQNDLAKISPFIWSRIRKLSFKRKRFLLKLHDDVSNVLYIAFLSCQSYLFSILSFMSQDIVEFAFESRNKSKNFWRKCIEQHTFFRGFQVKSFDQNQTKLFDEPAFMSHSGHQQSSERGKKDESEGKELHKSESELVDEKILKRSQEFINDVVRDAMKEVIRRESTVKLFDSDRNCNVKKKGAIEDDDHDGDDVDGDRGGHKRSKSQKGKNRECINENAKHRSKSQFTRSLFSRADRFYERVNQRKLSQFTPIGQQLLFVSVRSLPSLDSYSYKDDTLDIDPIEDLISNQIRKSKRVKKNKCNQRKSLSNDDGNEDDVTNPKSEGNVSIPSKHGKNNDDDDEEIFKLTASADVIANIEYLECETDYDSLELIAISQSQSRLQSQSFQDRLIERKREAKGWLRGKFDSIKDEIIEYNLSIHSPDDVDVLIKEAIREGRVLKKKESIKINYDISFGDEDEDTSSGTDPVLHKYTLSHPLFLYHLVIRSNLKRILLQ